MKKGTKPVKVTKLHIRKGDLVVVLSGKDKAKRGNVLRVYPQERNLIVEGINFVKRHSRPTQSNPKGGILEKESPINVAKVGLYCAKCNRPRRARFLKVEGRPTRICVKCGETLGKEL
ncbi:MAG: 50S ribosomal protein L24 [bacterium]|nr:50S ribosomal protein L24 [bacterium]